MWSAGGPNTRQNQNQGTGSKYGGMDLEDDLDGLDDDEDDDDDNEELGGGLNNQFSANKASSH